MPEETKTTPALPVQKRVFIGGLHQDVTASDLQQRFGRFGTVTSVDVRTKRDSQGQIANVFAHMDIDISDSNFKKCLSTYNEAKWKGHTMKVQLAKEDFLTKLAKERQEVKENPEPVRIKTRRQAEQDAAKERLEENMKKAGVEDFTMKKAVPGTPIPGETDWIVGKFGRVLPIMHLQRRDKRSRMTHDPSKYVHYVRKFKEDSKTDQIVVERPLEELTWSLPEEQSDIDRKRMGEFPEWKRKKKLKQETQGIMFKDESSQKKTALLGSQDGNQSGRKKSKPPEEDFEIVKTNGNKDIARISLVQLKPYTGQMEANSNQNSQDENKEHRHHKVTDLLEQCNLDTDEDSCGSADTDEICNFAKRAPKPETTGQKSLTNWAEDYYSKEKSAALSGDTSERDGFGEDGATGRSTQSINSRTEKRGQLDHNADDTANRILGEAISPTRGKIKIEKNSDDTDSHGSEMEFKVEEDLQVEETNEDMENDDKNDDNDKNYDSSDGDVSKNSSDDEDYDDYDLENSDEDDPENIEVVDKLSITPLRNHVQDGTKDNSSIETKQTIAQRESDDMENYSSSEAEGDASSNGEQSSSNSSGSDSDSSDSSDASDGKERTRGMSSVKSNDTEATKQGLTSGRSNLASPGDQRKHQQSNQIRLESVKKRQANIQTQKAAIQEALKSLDSKQGKLSAKMHVRFDSDDESSDGSPEDKTVTSKRAAPDKRPGLFDSDDDDEVMEQWDEANDEDRFKIKPQFQGKEGEKLLKLQDRIGIDTRFKLGEIFMEDEDDDGDEDQDEEDQDLKAEKQKSLSVLESIVGRQAVRSLEKKTTSNFRDPSRMRYDPTSEDHTQFEIADTSISSGTSSKKKDKLREEAPVPEVSKDTFYEVKELEFSQDKEENTPFRFFAEEESEAEDEGIEGLSTLQRDIQASTALGRRQLTLDSSDDESEEEEAKHDGKDDMDVTDASADLQSSSVYHAFFFQPDDVRLKTGPEQFCRKLSLEGMNQWFEEQKAGLQGEYKKRHQRALRDSKKAAQQGKKQRR